MPSDTRSVKVAAIYALLLHVATFFASSSSSVYLWGLNFWHGLPFWAAFGLFTCPALVVGMGEFVHHSLKLSNRASATTRLWTRMLPVALLGVAGLTFWVWRDTTHLMGDGMLLIIKTENGEAYSDSAPLSNALMLRAATLVRHVGGEASPEVRAKATETAVALLSVACGIIFVGLSWLVWGELAKGLFHRLSGTLLFLLSPTLQLFFGYAEFYPFAWVMALLTICLSFLAIRDKATPWTCIAAWVLAVGSHALLLLYLPVLVVCLKKRATLARLGVEFIIGLCIGLGVLVAVGVHPMSLLSALRGGGSLLGFSVQNRSFEAYGLLDPSHFIDIGNEILLVMPLAALIPWFALGHRLHARELLLAAVGIPALMITFIANARLGYARDWDLMALPALPLNLLSISLLLRVMREAPLASTQIRRVSLLLIGVALARTVAWVDLHHDPMRLLPRVDAIANANSLNAASARRHLRDDLATYFENEGDLDAAYREIQKAAAIEPTHAWTAFRLASLAHKVGDREAEFIALRRTVELDASLTAAWAELGRAYLDRGEVRAAEECFRRVLAVSPEDLKAHLGLALVQASTGNVQGALGEARIIAGLSTSSRIEALQFLATVLHQSGHGSQAAEVRRLAEAIKK